MTSVSVSRGGASCWRIPGRITGGEAVLGVLYDTHDALLFRNFSGGGGVVLLRVTSPGAIMSKRYKLTRTTLSLAYYALRSR